MFLPRSSNITKGLNTSNYSICGMIVQKEFLTRLKRDFNLNIYEVKIWSSLLSRGIASAGELADISGVPRSRCYDVLESLEKKGFIIMKIGKPIKYIAVQPEEIVERVKKNLRKESEVSFNIIESIRETDVFKELELLYKTGIEHVKVDDLADLNIGKENIYPNLKKMIEDAKKSVLIATTEKGFDKKIKLLKSIINKLNKKRVSIKIVAPINKKVPESIQKVAKVINTKNNVRFVAVDKKNLLFMLSDVNNNNEVGIFVKSEFFTNALVDLFERSLS